MMSLTPDQMRADMEKVLDEQGTSIVVKTFDTAVVGPGSYDDVYYATGSETASSGVGIFRSVNATDAQLLPQGQIILNPNKLYMHGSITTSHNMIIAASNGSEYEVIPGMGVKHEVISGVVIYQTAWVRTAQPSGTFI